MDREKNAFLLHVLSKYDPESVLEVGCNCGNKLYPIAVQYPHARLVGIDINSRAVELGAEWLKEADVGNVQLMAVRAEGLARFPGRSFDIVFSWATLLCLRPSTIRSTLADMTRIAAKGVVLLETQSDSHLRGDLATGVYSHGYWKRDYVSLLDEVAPQYDRANVEWIPRHIWPPGGGGGAVIEARRTDPA